MAQVSRTTAKTYFNTGDIPTESQFVNTLDSIAFFDDATFTALTGTAWDGSYKTKTLTANTALTFSSTKKSGVLIITQDGTGSRTLSINGVSVTINTAADSKTIISFLYDDVAADYIFNVDLGVVGNIGGGGGDTTAPVLSTATIEDATPRRIDLTYNETLDSGSVPATGDFGVLIDGVSSNPVTAVAIVGAVVRVTLTTDLTGGEVVLISYAPGTNKIQDVAGNDASSLSNEPVTNNVAGGSTDPMITTYINNLTAAGVTPTSGQQSGLHTAMLALDAMGKKSSLKRLWIPVWGTAATSWIDVVTGAVGTVGGGGTFSYTGSGAKPTGGTCYVQSVFTPSTGITSQDSVAIMAWATEATCTNTNECAIGAESGSDVNVLSMMYTGAGSASLDAANDDRAAGSSASIAGCDFLTRDASSTTAKKYQNGVLVDTYTNASTGKPTAQVALYSERGGGAGNTFSYASTRRHWCFAIWDDGFDATEASDVYDIFNDLKTALGA